jgi:hypothetical protein|tara:strand:- start:171 stop:371 length:201 start_codon:yes stop_codon:yes gene_type:complete
MTRNEYIKSLEKQIKVNSQFPHVADMVVKQRAKLARLKSMSDAQFEAEQSAGRRDAARSMARSLLR